MLLLCNTHTCYLTRYTGIGGLFSKLLGQKKEEAVLQSDKDKNKPWLMW